MCGEDFDLLLTVTNTFKCLYLVEISDDLSPLLPASGAGEGIRTLDPNLGKVVLYH